MREKFLPLICFTYLIELSLRSNQRVWSLQGDLAGMNPGYHLRSAWSGEKAKIRSDLLGLDIGHAGRPKR